MSIHKTVAVQHFFEFGDHKTAAAQRSFLEFGDLYVDVIVAQDSSRYAI